MSRSEDPTLFESRKKDHIKWSLADESQTGGSPSSLLKLAHDALPELDFADLKIQSFSKHYSDFKPLMVSSMTGGHSDSYKVNQILMSACAKKKWLFSSGSMRKELETLNAKKSDEWSESPSGFPLIGNIGLAQIINHTDDQIKKLCEVYKLAGLFVHLNPLQEVIQPEGTANFKDGLERLVSLKNNLQVPVFVKETGTGLSRKTFLKLKDSGLDAIDVSGFGGTHWGRVEALRADQNSLHAKVGYSFKDWGVATVESLKYGLETLTQESKTELWASGGLRSGLDAAICFSLGARICGFAKPFMEAALKSETAVVDLMNQIEYEIKVALFCTGSADLNKLQEVEIFLK
jgi:isopentenyl-diphosphate delta-isomerase